MALRYTDHCGKLEESEIKSTPKTTTTTFLESESFSCTEWKNESSNISRAETDENNEVVFSFSSSMCNLMMILTN